MTQLTTPQRYKYLGLRASQSELKKQKSPVNQTVGALQSYQSVDEEFQSVALFSLSLSVSLSLCSATVTITAHFSVQYTQTVTHIPVCRPTRISSERPIKHCVFGTVTASMNWLYFESQLCYSNQWWRVAECRSVYLKMSYYITFSCNHSLISPVTWPGVAQYSHVLTHTSLSLTVCVLVLELLEQYIIRCSYSIIT